MKRVIFFLVLAALLLIPLAIGYAHERANAAEMGMTITPADTASKPNIHIFGNVIGNITAGDLFTIDTSGTTGNTTFTLLMTNIDELTHNYRYMTMNVGIYVQNDVNGWEKITAIDGVPIPEILITMQNGSVSFTIPGNTKYKLTVENGCYRSYSFTPGKSVAIPQFCLTAS
jgi:PKD repeat protein